MHSSCLIHAFDMLHPCFKYLFVSSLYRPRITIQVVSYFKLIDRKNLAFEAQVLFKK